MLRFLCCAIGLVGIVRVGIAEGNQSGEGPLRLLVIGNSIVRHPPNASIGWTNDWGMAASSASNDFVHLVAKGLSNEFGKNVELRIGSNCGIEENHKAKIDFQSVLKRDLDWNPDCLVIALGENAKCLNSEDGQRSWEDALYGLGRAYQERNAKVQIVYRSVFWPDPVKNRIVKSAARRLGAAYADIGQIGNDHSFQARGAYWHSGVACHPNDKAMQVMADSVVEAIRRQKRIVDGDAPVVEVHPEGRDIKTDKWLIRKNENWVCEYSEGVLKRRQLKGVMIHSRGVSEADCEDLRSWGAKLVRLPIVLPEDGSGDGERELALQKWLDEFTQIVLPRLNRYGLSAVIALFTVPGGRERSGDYKFYSDERLFLQFRKEWSILAGRLKGRVGIAGFDLCNEPHQSHEASVADYWEAQRIVAEDIRKQDGETPIIVEAYGWDGPEAFACLSPLKVKNVIYQVHMYYPMPYTHQGLYNWDKVCSYPSLEEGWNRDYLIKVLSSVRAFEKRHGARIYCGEFSAVAWAKGAADYIRDCGEIFNEYGWDWTYHAFREYPGWSVEHTGSGKDSCVRADRTQRKDVLLELLK